MEQQKCMNVIRRLEKLTKQRPTPEDTLINIAETCENVDLGEEGWANFYSYITCQDRDEWVYMKKCHLKTLGDLTEEEMARIEQDLENKMPQKNNTMYRTYENGIETFVEVKYFDPNTLNNNGKQMVGSCESIQEEKSGYEFERVSEKSLTELQEDEKRPS